jgi:hypothetical protein
MVAGMVNPKKYFFTITWARADWAPYVPVEVTL